MDCSVTKRKGCNYCLRGKKIHNENFGKAIINDEHKTIEIIIADDLYNLEIIINYCPICGKEL